MFDKHFRDVEFKTALEGLIENGKIGFSFGGMSVVLVIRNRQHVYKLWYSDPGFEKYLKYADEHKANPCLMKTLSNVRKIRVNFKDCTKVFSIVKLEKLQPLMLHDRKLLDDFVRFMVADINEAEYKFVEQSAKFVPYQYALGHDFVKTMYDLRVLANALETCFDCHSGNVMKRAGQFVIIDPYLAVNGHISCSKDFGLLVSRNRPRVDTKEPITKSNDMTKMIVAVDRGNAIGWKDGRLPWKIPADMKRFKELTTGNSVVMGRKTFDSLNRPEGLPNRKNFVATGNRDNTLIHVETIARFDLWLEVCKERGSAALGCVGDIWIIGGASIYDQAIDLQLVDEIYLTVVDTNSGADVTLKHDLVNWKLFVLHQRKLGVEWILQNISHPAVTDSGISYTFITLKKLQ